MTPETYIELRQFILDLEGVDTDEMEIILETAYKMIEDK